MTIHICFDILLKSGERCTCLHQNFSKEQYISVIHRAKIYCKKFGFTLTNSVYSWRKPKSFLCNSDAIRKEIIANHFASKLYPNNEIAEVHLKIERL